MLPQVTSLAWRPDGQQLAMAGYKQVHRLAMPGGTSLGPLTDLSDLVRAVAWSPDGSMMAAGGGTPGAFGEIVVFDAATGAPRARLEGHRDYVYHLAFNHDGTRLASCGYDKVIRIWDTATGKAIGVLKEHTEAVFAVAFSGDGALLASAAADRSVKIWNVADGVRLYTITDATDAVLTLAFRPGTTQLAAGGQDKAHPHVGSRRHRRALAAQRARASVGGAAPGVPPDGSTLASTGADTDVKIWDAETGQPGRVLGRKATGRRRWRGVRTAAVGRRPLRRHVSIYELLREAGGDPIGRRRHRARRRCEPGSDASR